VRPTNYETRVRQIAPAVAGLEVRSVDLGEHLELVNGTDEEIVVLGYQGGARLRAEPGSTVRWHDHRAHWMGDRDPPVVRHDPGARHVVQRWFVELEQDGRQITVVGDVVWVPAPSPYPWLIGALLVAAAVVFLSRSRSWRFVLAGAFAVALVAEVVHVAGSWGATTESTFAKLGSQVYAIGGIAFALVALWLLLRRRDPYDATPAALLAGLVLALIGGLADLQVFTRSQLPSTLPAGVTRMAVMLVLGLGTGIAIAAALRLRRPDVARRSRRPTPAKAARVTS
jgi:hypothetical protein